MSIVIYTCMETKNYLDNFEDNVKHELGKNADLILDYLVVYIHTWQSKTDKLNDKYSIYIGETNDILERTEQHWDYAKIPKNLRKPGNWQYHMLEDKDIIG